MPALAQINVARGRWPIDDPRMAGFVARLDRVNAAAEAHDGFLWRFRTETGNATDYVFDPRDPRLILNMSVWRDVEALHRFTYRQADHMEAFRKRGDWFEKMDEPALALWWVEAPPWPDPAKGLARLALLRKKGPSPRAFSLKRRFAPDGAEIVPQAKSRQPA